MTYETIFFERTDAVATLTLNRPDRLNAFTAKVHEEVRAALRTVAEDDAIRTLVLTGAGRGFCAGQDLQEVRPSDGDAGRDLGQRLDRNYNRLIRTIRALPKPVIASVNGVAAGAGANLALACDIVIAARGASFIQAFARIGLVPDSGGSYFLPRRVGTARATALFMLGDSVTAEEAVASGMIWRCVDDTALAAETGTLAKRLAAAPTKTLGLIKRLMDASAANSLDQQLDLERDFQRLAGASEDYREGVAAFREKRPPQFKGR
ncbi:MAG: 2-(1,2-epoxy-1,2-dihydrophenyl)acetyl-CoA isomerase PaaG [Alphaproteobacteria bacterium]